MNHAGTPDRATSPLSGKTALVTGASGGIGSAVAAGLGRAGANVLVCGRRKDPIERLADQIGGTPFVADLTGIEACRAAVETAQRRYGRLDLVHLSVGARSYDRDLTEFNLSEYRTVVAANLDSIVFSLAACVPALLAAGGGAITLMSSLAGITGYGRYPIYTMTKAALIGLVRATSRRLSRNGVYLCALCPSFTDTPLLGDLREHLAARDHPLLQPSEVAAAVLHRLCGAPGDEPIWTIQPGVPPTPYLPAGIPGPHVPTAQPPVM
ncbi:SDR family NAD(P)-dependent oxidoreductase [Allorhizocola rhizosphaerae]|uniref:SDR family NAD(P)-dependent oxidoreductase n=1 Tax=Allorhizocola rhizosphaerae TaxID=1872709 RepID=UPI000E3C6D27|nr:SDR family oxidoreductase [Allorhizocola rhizosphaerae]